MLKNKNAEQYESCLNLTAMKEHCAYRKSVTASFFFANKSRKLNFILACYWEKRWTVPIVSTPFMVIGNIDCKVMINSYNRLFYVAIHVQFAWN